MALGQRYLEESDGSETLQSVCYRTSPGTGGRILREDLMTAGETREKMCTAKVHVLWKW